MARIFLITSLFFTSFFGFVDVAKADACTDEYNQCTSTVVGECAALTGSEKTECESDIMSHCDENLTFCETASGGGGTSADKYGLKQTATEAQLPNIDQDLPGIVGIIIAALLGLVATVFFALMVYGGFLWMTAAGNGEQVGQAKKLIMNAVLGIIVISAAYAITNFVIKAIT
jgi:Type IV secretion system pilin